ncbi:PadR family transcriptional regulator [Lysinibacillus sp. 3P01SB]|uniref:PadR family transcriptional regulator n=1 Tax=Lysinibacillus sp. 3P01SB TaxID=3132284 RepID=UPI0039A71D14
MSIQIFILSKLMKGNSYPYELEKQLSNPVPLNTFAGLTESKLSYHFESLVKQGLIEPAGVMKEENSPERQVFAITDKGREELPKRIYRLLEGAKNITDMVLGLANLKYVNRERVLEILEQKLESRIARRKRVEEIRSQAHIDQENQLLVDLVGKYMKTKGEHTVQWLEELIKEIRLGNI